MSSLQKENQRLRNDLDREIHSRQTLELQIESKEQTINSLKSQMEARRHLHIENSSPLKEKPVCINKILLTRFCYYFYFAPFLIVLSLFRALPIKSCFFQVISRSNHVS